MTAPYDPVGSFEDGFRPDDGNGHPAVPGAGHTPDVDQTLWVAHTPGTARDGVTLFDAAGLSQTMPVAAPPAEPTVFRFGPGVPPPRDELDPNVVAAWHGEARQERRGGGASGEPRSRRRRLRGWLLPAAVLIAVLIYVLWPRHGAPVAVLGAQVAAASTGPACDRVVTYTGTIETNGDSGTVTYRWTRSDGTTSGPFQQPVAAGEKAIQVTLRWTIAGHGALRATASLQILSPGQRTAAATVAYSCR